jgi:hypothetical protein
MPASRLFHAYFMVELRRLDRHNWYRCFAPGRTKRASIVKNDRRSSPANHASSVPLAQAGACGVAYPLRR